MQDPTTAATRKLVVGSTMAAVALAASALVLIPSALGSIFSSRFLPHAYCYLYDTKLIALHVGSDAVIWLSYVAISCTLVYLVWRTRREIPFSWMFLAFGLFIVACGSTHLLEVITTWTPIFWVDAWTNIITAIDRLRNYKLRLETGKFGDGANSKMEERTRDANLAFENALDEDLNTAEALAAVFEYVRDTNTAMDSGEFQVGNVAGAVAFLDRFDAVFDVLRAAANTGGLTDAEIDALIAERTTAKKSRNFARADEIRAELAAQGIVLEDTKDGVRWKRS